MKGEKGGEGREGREGREKGGEGREGARRREKAREGTRRHEKGEKEMLVLSRFRPAVVARRVQQLMRLGFLVDSLLSRYQGRLLDGAIRAARRQGARVIGFQGSFFHREGEPHSFDGSFLYELAGPNAVDGLVVVSNILASVVGIESLRTFCANVGVPIVSVGELPGFPEVGIESRDGLTRGDFAFGDRARTPQAGIHSGQSGKPGECRAGAGIPRNAFGCSACRSTSA